MKLGINKVLCLATLVVLLISMDASALKNTDETYREKAKDILRLIEEGVILRSSESGDLDPLVDLHITVTIKTIRALDTIDILGDPDFYVKVRINGVEHASPIWHNQKYAEPNWSVTKDVPDDEEFVNISIQLWDWNVGRNKLCDISPNSKQIDYTADREIRLMYSLKSAHWVGDDYIGDQSGYGRLNGCDDNSIYQNDRDCELWFDITQNDYDGDGIPYWTEVNVFGTDPLVDDRGRDDDNDGIPIEWEFKWGHYFSYDWYQNSIENRWRYDPFVWEDHRHLDPDNDGLDNIEEYLTSQWGSDPFRKDIFLELDQMEIGENEKSELLPELAKDLLRDAFGKYNIVFQIDDGCMGGGELLPFKESTSNRELRELYYKYFLHEDYDNWRQGAFHYALILYNSSYPGFAFWGGDENYPYADSFQLKREYHENKIYELPLANILINKRIDPHYRKSVVYASVMMHETGHVLGIYSGNTPGCDNQDTYFPWQKSWWKWRTYMSCMNYAYVYQYVDYSDGSRGKNDFDDWARIDLTLFQGG